MDGGQFPLCEDPMNTAEVAGLGRRIEVRGTVQGVGFRPWIYRLAQEEGGGRVWNDEAGVEIEAFGGSGGSRCIRPAPDPPPSTRVVGERHVSRGNRYLQYGVQEGRNVTGSAYALETMPDGRSTAQRSERSDRKGFLCRREIQELFHSLSLPAGRGGGRERRG